MSDTREGRPGNEVIRDQTVRLDYGHFVKKSFLGCRLVFAGGLPPVLQDCDFIDCGFVLEGAALNTAQFLSLLAGAGNEEARKLVLGMIGVGDA